MKSKNLGLIWKNLKHLDQHIAQAQSERDESEKADQQVRELDGFRTQMQHLQAQVEHCTIRLVATSTTS